MEFSLSTQFWQRCARPRNGYSWTNGLKHLMWHMSVASVIVKGHRCYQGSRQITDCLRVEPARLESTSRCPSGKTLVLAKSD